MKKYLLSGCIFISMIGCLWGQEVALTVYNQNRALVREARTLTLESGISTMSFTDVAARIDPTSVHFKSLTAPDKLNILEQNYEYDLVNAQKIMEKYIDQDIRLVMEKGEVFGGKLLSAAGSHIVLQNDEGGIQILREGGVQHFDFPKLPE